MKRYLVFAYVTYNGNGGWNDFVGSFDELEQARKRKEEEEENSTVCSHVVDSEIGQIVDE